MDKRDLTEKQKKFIDYYIELGNATEAAKKAGYKGKSHESVGSQNLTKLKVFIDEKIATKDNERIASQDEVLSFLSAILRNEETEQVVVVESIGDYQSEARMVDKNISAKDRIKAAELLGKRYGTWEKTDSENINRPIININLGENDG